MKFENDTLVVALTAPIGGGVILDSKELGYLNSEGLMQVREAVTNSAQVCVTLESAPCKFQVDLKNISIAEGLLEITNKFQKTIVCRVHKVPYIPQSAELIKMGFISDACYNRGEKLYKKVKFKEWVPDYVRQLVFSTEICGRLVVMNQKDAVEHLPHCVKIIGYLTEDKENKPLFS